MKRQLILTVLAVIILSSTVISGTIFQEDFEGYSLNTWPASWVKDANANDSANNKIVSDPKGSGSKVLKMYGSVGGCWGALAYHPCAFPDDFWVEAKVLNGSETLSGCHPGRAGFGMRHGTYWYAGTNPAFDFIQFTKTALTTDWSDTLLSSYQTNQWYDINVHIERTGTQAKVTYFVNGQNLGERTNSLSYVPADRPLNHLEIFSQEGTVYFDDIKVYTGGTVEVPKGDYKLNLPGDEKGKLLLWNSKSEAFEFTIDSSTYDAQKDAFIITHGWNGSSDDAWVKEMANFISGNNINVFVWDWKTEALSVPMVISLVPLITVPSPPTSKVDHQSEYLATNLQKSIPDIKSAKSIQMIGHSLGAALVARTAKLLEFNNIPVNVNRVTLLDAPENWGPDVIGKSVQIKEVIKDISDKGVNIDNYPTQFGVNYPKAMNFYLRDAADGPGSSSGWGKDHSFSHAWYNTTILPVAGDPVQSFREEVKFLSQYYSLLDSSDFWMGADSVGCNLDNSNFEFKTLYPKQTWDNQYTLSYYPFVFENWNDSAIWDTSYNTLSLDTFENPGAWKVDGTANIQSGQMNIYTNSPSYLFTMVDIPENASVLRFDYQFSSDTEGDMLYLFADEELLWVMSSTPHNMENLINTGWMDIAHLAGKTVRLCFALNNTTQEQAHAVIDNLEFAEEIGPENGIPTANAGIDIVAYADATGFAKVALDGSASSDPDGDELFFMWVLGDTVIANGTTPTVSLPVGVHTIQLTVRDLFADSETDDVSVTVIAPIQGTLKITPTTINRKSNQPQIRASIKLPVNISKKDVDLGELLVLCPGEIKATSQKILPTETNGQVLNEIVASFDKAALMNAVQADGDTQLKVAGKLKSGQYFYGEDTIKVIH